VSFGQQMAGEADAFDVRTTLTLIALILDLLVSQPVPQFATLLHSLILLRVIPPRLIPHSDLCLVLLVSRSRLRSLPIQQIDGFLRQYHRRHGGVGHSGSRHTNACESCRVQPSRRA
jgi:hypothetical protein